MEQVHRKIIRPYEILLGAILPLMGSIALPGMAGAQGQRFGQGGQAPQAPVQPLGCDQVRISTLQTDTRNHTQNYRYSTHRTGASFDIGGPFTILGPYRIMPGTGMSPSELAGGPDENSFRLEMPSGNPASGTGTIYHAQVKVEFGPDVQLDNGAAEYQGPIASDQPLTLPFHHVKGIDCNTAVREPTQPNPVVVPPGPPAPVTTPGGPSVAIYWTDHNNQNIAGAAQSVAAGVAIHVSQGCAPGPDGTKGARADWAVARSLTGGFQASQDRGGVQDVDLNHPAITVYGAFPGSHPMIRLTCTDAKGRANSADTRFDITGPVLYQDGVTPRPGQSPQVKLDFNTPGMIGGVGIQPSTKMTTLGYGLNSLRGHEKIPYRGFDLSFHVIGRLPEGSEIKLVQVVQKDTTETTFTNQKTGYCDVITGVDYYFQDRIQDSPDAPLPDKKQVKDESRRFEAGTYLMWRASVKDTYIPLAAVKWRYKGKIVQSENGMGAYGSGWLIDTENSLSQLDPVRPTASLADFPNWTSKTTHTCKPSP